MPAPLARWTDRRSGRRRFLFVGLRFCHLADMAWLAGGLFRSGVQLGRILVCFVLGLSGRGAYRGTLRGPSLICPDLSRVWLLGADWEFFCSSRFGFVRSGDSSNKLNIMALDRSVSSGVRRGLLRLFDRVGLLWGGISLVRSLGAIARIAGREPGNWPRLLISAPDCGGRGSSLKKSLELGPVGPLSRLGRPFSSGFHELVGSDRNVDR